MRTLETQNTKDDQIYKGTFSFGTGPEVVLLVGSCRVVPYANLFLLLNKNNRFNFHLVNLVNFHFNARGESCDQLEAIAKFETSPYILDLLKRVRWYIHEHSENYGMFNSDRNAPKNIYQFGLKPDVDVSLPNFNDIFILFQEYIRFFPEVKRQAEIDVAANSQLSTELQQRIKTSGLAALEKFLRICRMTSLPEMADLFEQYWRVTRYFWSSNHISSRFIHDVFKMMNDKFLHLDVDQSVFDFALAHDPYASPCCPITEYDMEHYGLKWPQPVVPLKIVV